jgi:cation transport ATPase
VSNHRHDEQRPDDHGPHHSDHHQHVGNENEREPVKPGYPEHPEQDVAEDAREDAIEHHPHDPHNDHGHDHGRDDHRHDPHHDHDAHAGHSVEAFRSKFWLSLLLTLPVVFWSEHIQMLLGYTAPAFPGSEWIGPVLGTVIFFYGGWVFIQGAIGELRAKLPGMMTLISLAITVAFVFSWVVELGLIEAEALWWELATLVTIMLLGHWIEMRSIHEAQGALQALAKLLPDTATRVTDGGEEEVPVSELGKGDVVLVRPGASVPVDGVVQRGSSDLNESMITGESRPVKKGEGDEVIAGTINGEGSLRVEVTGTVEMATTSGTARPRAWGQAMTSTVTTRTMEKSMGAPMSCQTIRVMGGGPGRSGRDRRGRGAADRRGRRDRVRAPHRKGHRQDGGRPGDRGPVGRRVPGHHRQGCRGQCGRDRVSDGRPGATEGGERPDPG